MSFRATANRIFSSKYVAFSIALFIFFACSLPGKELPATVNLHDKLSHFFTFGVWTFCWQGAFSSYIRTIVFGIIFGIFIEIWQGILPASFHRHFDWNDALADSIGVLIGVVLWKIKTLLNL